MHEAWRRPRLAAEPAGHSLADASRRTAPSAGRSQETSARRRRGSRGHARGGMADRQLPSHRRADPRISFGPAAGLLSAIAEACRRPLPATRACSASPGPLSRIPTAASTAICWLASARLPTGSAADHRRIMGGVDHAADRHDREPAPPRRTDRQRPRRAACRRRSQTVCSTRPAEIPRG